MTGPPREGSGDPSEPTVTVAPAAGSGSTATSGPSATDR
jgi:hypothetical protein